MGIGLEQSSHVIGQRKHMLRYVPVWLDYICAPEKHQKNFFFSSCIGPPREKRPTRALTRRKTTTHQSKLATWKLFKRTWILSHCLIIIDKSRVRKVCVCACFYSVRRSMYIRRCCSPLNLADQPTSHLARNSLATSGLARLS